VRQGYWQERKRAWLALGIESEVGRGENLLNFSDEARYFSKGGTLARGKGGETASLPSTSIFDPVLCELAYRWFSPPGGLILDPFAGGSVRGIVAAQLGRNYRGIDLRPEQVEANRQQADKICHAASLRPEWFVGDSRNATDIALGTYDFVFSCPPYGDLERYSDDPLDLSTMAHDDFLKTYRQIIASAIAMLKPDRFACVVVGDFRDKGGIYRNFVSDTIAAFQDAGAMLYNEAILVIAIASLPIRAGRVFSAARKLGKAHQNVLVFCKGSPEKAAAACGEIEVFVPEAMQDPEG
jgi:DNA modification methylase